MLNIYLRQTFKYQISHIKYMNTRFKRLNNKTNTPPAPKPQIKAAPFVDLPPMIIIDDWLKREREKKKPKDEPEQQIRLPLDMPLPPKPRQDSDIREPEEIIIDLN
jgi:hypothetical protein